MIAALTMTLWAETLTGCVSCASPRTQRCPGLTSPRLRPTLLLMLERLTAWCDQSESQDLTPAPTLVSVPVPGVAEEMLLQETVGDATPVTIGDETPADIVTADIVTAKPSFSDNMAAFDEKMFSLGMRSPPQFNTPADENCGHEGILNYK